MISAAVDRERNPACTSAARNRRGHLPRHDAPALPRWLSRVIHASPQTPGLVDGGIRRHFKQPSVAVASVQAAQQTPQQTSHLLSAPVSRLRVRSRAHDGRSFNPCSGLPPGQRPTAAGVMPPASRPPRTSGDRTSRAALHGVVDPHLPCFTLPPSQCQPTGWLAAPSHLPCWPAPWPRRQVRCDSFRRQQHADCFLPTPLCPPLCPPPRMLASLLFSRPAQV